jgi:hypothetical protein
MSESTADECRFAIHTEAGEYLIVSLVGRTHDAQDYWDGNWITAEVKLSARSFTGQFSTLIRSEELVSFYLQLNQLQSDLKGTAEFTTMEHGLEIQMNGDGLGHMTAYCKVRDWAGTQPNTLQFYLKTDQTFTRSTLNDLLLATQAFPVIGTP